MAVLLSRGDSRLRLSLLNDRQLLGDWSCLRLGFNCRCRFSRCDSFRFGL